MTGPQHSFCYNKISHRGRSIYVERSSIRHVKINLYRSCELYDEPLLQIICVHLNHHEEFILPLALLPGSERPKCYGFFDALNGKIVELYNNRDKSNCTLDMKNI